MSIISTAFLVTSSMGKQIELIKNEGFEYGMDHWDPFSYYIEHDRPASINETKSHWGKYSLDTSIRDIETTRIGRGARQTIQLEKLSELNLSFWVYLGTLTGSQNFHTNIAMILHFSAEKPRLIVYNVAWDPTEQIYHGFPLPNKNSDNITNILIGNMLSHRWNHIERNVAKDYMTEYPTADFRTVSSLTIEIVTVRFQKIGFAIDTLWDDISLKYESEGALTPWTSSSTIIPNPTTTSPTPLPSITEKLSTQKDTFSRGLGDIGILVIVAVIAVIALLTYNIMKKRKK